MTGIDQYDGKITRRSSSGHVPCVLLVTWTVGNDELAFAGTEVAIGHIDGDALFTFAFESIHKK